MLLQIVHIILTVLWWFIIAQAVMSWLIAFNVINTHNDFVNQLWTVLDRITEPLYRPFRRVMPDFRAVAVYETQKRTAPWAALNGIR